MAPSRPWRAAGAAAMVTFGALAAASLTAPDPLFDRLLTLVYAGAALMGARIARGRPVYRWICVILVVVPAELALMTILFEDPERRAVAATATATEALTRHAALAALGMLAVASWAALVAFARPHHDETTPLL